MPGETEWKACERPLGVWNALWLIRVALGSLLAYWTWQRERAKRLAYAYTSILFIVSVANSDTVRA